MCKEENRKEYDRLKKQRQRSKEAVPAEVTTVVPEMYPLPSSSSSSSSTSKKKNTCAVTYNFETHLWDHVNGKMELWVKAFPAVDVQGELHRMSSWLEDNPKNRKSNYAKFIHNWLSRAQDKAPKSGGEKALW